MEPARARAGRPRRGRLDPQGVFSARLERAVVAVWHPRRSCRDQAKPGRGGCRARAAKSALRPKPQGALGQVVRASGGQPRAARQCGSFGGSAISGKQDPFSSPAGCRP